MNPKTISAIIFLTISSFWQLAKASYRVSNELDSQEGVTSPPDDDDSVTDAPNKRAREIDTLISKADAFGSKVDLKQNRHLSVFDREDSPVEEMQVMEDHIPETIPEPTPAQVEKYNEYCVNQLIDSIQYNGTAEYVDHLYNKIPLAFQRVDRNGVMVLLRANQVQINHLVQHYGHDQLLMERIFEACCRNPKLYLPSHLFTVDVPELTLRRIEYVRTYCPRDMQLVGGTHLGPVHLDFLLPSGETLLNRALWERNYFVMKAILKRNDASQIILMENSRNQNVFDFIRSQDPVVSTGYTDNLMQLSIPLEYGRQIRAGSEANFSKLFDLIDALKTAAGNDQSFLFEIAGEVINLMGEELDNLRFQHGHEILPQLVKKYEELLALCPKVGINPFSYVTNLVEKYGSRKKTKRS